MFELRPYYRSHVSDTMADPSTHHYRCGACYNRFMTLKRKTPQGQTVSDEWKVLKRPELSRRHLTKKPALTSKASKVDEANDAAEGSKGAVPRCRNEECRRDLTGLKPTDRLCNTCYGRYIRLKKKTPAGQEVSDTWKKSQKPNRPEDSKKEAASQFANRSLPLLRDIARKSFRETNPAPAASN